MLIFEDRFGKRIRRGMSLLGALSLAVAGRDPGARPAFDGFAGAAPSRRRDYRLARAEVQGAAALSAAGGGHGASVGIPAIDGAGIDAQASSAASSSSEKMIGGRRGRAFASAVRASENAEKSLYWVAKTGGNLAAVGLTSLEYKRNFRIWHRFIEPVEADQTANIDRNFRAGVSLLHPAMWPGRRVVHGRAARSCAGRERRSRLSCARQKNLGRRRACWKIGRWGVPPQRCEAPPTRWVSVSEICKNSRRSLPGRNLEIKNGVGGMECREDRMVMPPVNVRLISPQQGKDIDHAKN